MVTTDLFFLVFGGLILLGFAVRVIFGEADDL